MGITKTAKNIFITAKGDYTVRAGSLVEMANKINIEAKNDNLSLISNKAIRITGDKGIKYGKYAPSDLVVEKSGPEYKLKSTYAHDQLCILADELGEKMFMYWALYLFGPDIEVEAYSKLYRALSDRSIEAPEIIVVKGTVNANKAGYSNKRKKILVSQSFLEDAVKIDEEKTALFAALVEEYGHHIDNLLRTDLSPEPIPDADIIDEGAKFAYNFFTFNVFKENNITFAEASTPGFSGKLVADFSKEHELLKEYVNEEQQFDGVPLADVECFGAGFLDPKEHGYGHGTIEMEALFSIKPEIFTEDQVLQIYYGNWLRDYSQMIVAATINLSKKAAAAGNKVSSKNPLKMSHKGWVELLEIFATKEFVYDMAVKKAKITKKPVSENYKAHLITFRKKFGELTKDILGVYRPEEHIDNPYQLEDDSTAVDMETKKRVSFMYQTPEGKIKKELFHGQKTSIGIDPVRNMKKYIHGNGYAAEKTNVLNPSAVTYMKQQLILACRKGQNHEGFMHLGGALHVLEDYFSHSNFVEVALIKNGAKRVYPWVEGKQYQEAVKIPIVTGIFLLDDTLASVAPKMAEAMFPIHPKEYKTRKKGERTFPEGFMETMLTNLAEAQQSDEKEKNPNYKGRASSVPLTMLNEWLEFVDWKAEYIEKNKDNWKGKSWLYIDKKMHNVGNALAFIMNVSFNIFLDVTDDAVKIIQSLEKGYGDNPTHTQIAKDDPHHPLHRLAAELAMMAVRDVGTRFKKGANGEELAKYVADTYFVHPAMVKNEWTTKVDAILKKWIQDPKNLPIIRQLESATIYHEHAPGVMREVKQTYNNTRKEMEAIKKNPGSYTRARAAEMKEKILKRTTEMNDKAHKNLSKKNIDDWLLEQEKKKQQMIEKIKHYTPK
jgi:hypothetical protein